MTLFTCRRLEMIFKGNKGFAKGCVGGDCLCLLEHFALLLTAILGSRVLGL